MNNKTKILIFTAMVILVYLILCLQQARNFSVIDFSIDFRSYWLGFQIFYSGENPYNYKVFSSLYTEIFASVSGPLYFLPFVFGILAPVYLLPFEISALCFLLINILIFIFVVGVLNYYFKGTRQTYLVGLFLSALFLPLLSVLQFGQTSLLLLLSVVLFLDCIRKEKNFLAGLSLSLALVKPHLLVLFWPVLFVWVLYEKRWNLLLGFLTSIISLSAFLLVINPGIFQYRYFSTQSALAYIPASLMGPIRIWAISISEKFDLFLICGLYFLLAASFVLYFWKHRTSWNWNNKISGLICLSLLFSPYGHIYDHSILIVALVQIVVQSFDKANFRLLYFLVFYEILLLALGFMDYADWRIFWLPIPIFALLITCGKHDISTKC